MPNLNRIVGSLKSRGFLRSLMRAYDRLLNVAFDVFYGVDTRFLAREQADMIAGLSNEQLQHGNPSQPSAHRILRHALGSLHAPLSEYSFVDLGSGRGKAVLVASEFPFKKIIGVEYSSALVQIAERNVERFRGGQAKERVEFVCCDASRYTPPAGPSVYFLFNPFDEPILRRVIENIAAIIDATSGPSFLIYENPVFLPIVQAMGSCELRKDGDGLAIVRIAPRSAPQEDDAQPESLPCTKIEYARMSEDQLDAVVKLHDAIFPESTTSKLGISKAALRWHLAGPDHLWSSTASVGGKVVGFGVVVSEYSRLRFVMRNLTLIVRGIKQRRKGFFRTASRGLTSAFNATARRKAREKTGKLILIGIAQEYQGLGVGRNLLGQVERNCTLLGVTKLELTVDPANERAIQLYEGHRWQKVPQDGVWRGVMSKVLAGNS